MGYIGGKFPPQPLLHVLKFPLLFLGLQHLLDDGLLLVGDFPDQGGDFLVHIPLLHLLQVQAVDGLHDLSRGPHGEKRRHQHHEKAHGAHGIEKVGKDGKHVVFSPGQPQHLAAFQPLSVVEGGLLQGVGPSGRLPLARGKGLPDLLPVPVIFHDGRIRLVVIEHRSVRIHQGDPLFRLLQFS